VFDNYESNVTVDGKEIFLGVRLSEASPLPRH